MKWKKEKDQKRKEGLFIVCEGLDGAGKTTTIKEFLKKQYGAADNYTYSKGLKSNTFMGRIAARKPSTFSFLLELAYVTQTIVKPNLRKNRTVMQDRYYLSVLSYNPDKIKWNDKLAYFLVKPLIKKPDVVVYFKVDLEERIRRLKMGSENRYHSLLIKNPGLVYEREKSYLQLLDNLDCRKAIIDTSKMSIDSAVAALEAAIGLPSRIGGGAH